MDKLPKYMDNAPFLVKAKDRKDGKWVTGYFLGYLSPAMVMIIEEKNVCWCNGVIQESPISECNPETLCRCTNQKDCKGNFIFQGDILAADFLPFHYEGADDYYGVVFFDNETARFGIETVKTAPSHVLGAADGNVSCFDDYDVVARFEIVGNVYDNINLLRENYKFEQDGTKFETED